MSRARSILHWRFPLRSTPNPFHTRPHPTSPTTPSSTLIYTRYASTASSSSENDAAFTRHAAKVEKLSQVVKDFYTSKEKFRIYHGSTNSTRPRNHSHKTNVVDTSPLNEVLSIVSKDNRSHVVVEPNVPMDRLVEATLEHNLIPKVVMEFPGITVGGGYAGTSGESSSFKHGFFDQTINNIEMVLADGRVVNASTQENPDLFHGAAGALGTLGITTKVELQVVPAKRYVEVEYHPVTDVRQALDLISIATSDKSVDYIDGILYSQTSGAIVVGRMVDYPSRPDTPTRTFSRPEDPWFYMHVQSLLQASSPTSSKPIVELVPLPEYLFRYDRGGFWVGHSAFTHLHFPFTARTRRWLDDFLHTRMLYSALHASGQSRTYLVQDLAMPYESVDEFVKYCDRELGIWPLWLCPLKQSRGPTMHPHYPIQQSSVQVEGKQEESEMPLLMNVGLWGTNPTMSRSYDAFLNANRALEQKLTDLGGMKWLYAHTYYSKSEFWSQFDEDWYNNLRKKYGAHGYLPSVYDKVHIDVDAQKAELNTLKTRLLNIWPLGAAWGIYKAIQSKSYIEARKAKWRSWQKPTPSSKQ
ncbi:hypothetical protein H2198_005095 [Neophaeococcomyces mojaviensis]|uniref:Uncharacterized protein n=1 Tax=Neophaeococcomyces mojaviensis TaxID=3383035 RepID=A0ACC3A6N4_9EURO|nr:hypothetical protein H2198_005095 [Knufia sp. JES_112]